MEHWERDFNITWKLQEWQDIANNLSTISNNTALLKSNYKTLIRWSIRKAKMSSQASSRRFRICSQVGTIPHM